MKYFLFLLSTLTLSLASCSKNEESPITDQFIFCNSVLQAQGLAEYIGNTADVYVAKYQSGDDVPEMTVTATADTTALSISFVDTTGYHIRGILEVKLANATGVNVKLVSMSRLTYTYPPATISGSMTITDVTSNDNSKEENIALTKFSVGSGSTPSITLYSTYKHKRIGLSTELAADDESYWLEGTINGESTHALFGTFTGAVISPVAIANGTYTSGEMTFTVQNIGGQEYPIGLTLANGRMAVSHKGNTGVY